MAAGANTAAESSYEVVSGETQMRTPCRSLTRAFVVASAAAITGAALGQCPSPDWLPGDGIAGIQGFTEYFGGVVGEVNSSILWDPDGAGPQGPMVVVGGTFSFAGNTRANSIAGWDGTQWNALGAGIDGPVLALAVLPNGHLVAGGFFAGAGGNLANNIAEWDGSTWQPLGDGVDGVVTTLAVRSNGHLIVGGSFVVAGASVVARAVARWDGVDWFAINQGLRTGATGNEAGSCNALAVLTNGDIAVGGTFDRAGGTNALNIARLRFAANGTTSTWAAYGSGTDGYVEAIEPTPGSGFVAGGTFTNAGGVVANNIAAWNGTSWSALGSGVDDSVIDVKRRSNGDIVAVGLFGTVNGAAMRGLASWNGSSWSALGDLSPQLWSYYDTAVYSLLNLPNGDLVVGGVLKAGVAKWNGSAWSHLGSGFNNNVSTIARMSDGDVVVSGPFTTIPGAEVSNVARLHQGTWTGMGGGLDYVPSSFLPGPGGEVIACGLFVPNDVDPPVGRVDRWNGTSWEPVSTGFVAYALARLNNGDLVAAGHQSLVGGVYRWTGATWELLGDVFRSNGDFAAPSALAVMPNGDLIAGGVFDTVGTTVAYTAARWDGTVWHPMGNGVGDPFNFEGILDMALTPGGQLIVAGQFVQTLEGTVLNNVSQWDGSAWQPLGVGLEGLAFSIAVLPNGEVVAAGPFTGSVSRWNGSGWSNVGPLIEGSVGTVESIGDGNIAIGGVFAFVGGRSSANFAIFGCEAPACVADVDDGSATGTPDGGVTIDDLLYYLVIFEAGGVAADVDDGSGSGTPDGGVTIDDLLYYLVRFEQGC